MSTVQLVPPPAAHFDENNFFATQPLFLFNGAIYKFMGDGVGGMGGGGGTSQIFIHKSLDNGATWADITPAAPQKIETVVSQLFVRSGNRIYCTSIVGVGFHVPRTISFFVFDLPTQSWVANSASLVFGSADEGLAAVTRANGQIVVVTGNSIIPNVQLSVYDTTTDTWVAGPTAVPGLAWTEVCSGGLDSVGHAHFLVMSVPGIGYGSGTCTLQHFVVDGANNISAIQNVFVFPHNLNTLLPCQYIGQPVFYLDVGTGLRMIAFPVTPLDTSFNATSNFLLFTATEADVPVWSNTAVPTGENFAQVTIASSFVTAMCSVTLLPVQFSGQTQLWIFWTSNGQALAIGNASWNNFFRRIAYTNAAFSAVTTEYSSLNTKNMIGAVFPILLSNNGTSALIGGHTPVINFDLFVGAGTKYQSLTLWWMSFSAVAPGGGGSTTAQFSATGGMGCTPQCTQICAPTEVLDLKPVNRGGDPAIMFAVLAALVLLDEVLG